MKENPAVGKKIANLLDIFTKNKLLKLKSIIDDIKSNIYEGEEKQ